jgi:hypothetical protein
MPLRRPKIRGKTQLDGERLLVRFLPWLLEEKPVPEK